MPDQAQDLFAGFLEKRRVSQAVRERGRFRSFLMTSVENFLHNTHRRGAAQKRGGGKCFVSLENEDPEARYQEVPADDGDPARTFEQRWASTLLQTVLGRGKRRIRSRGSCWDFWCFAAAHLGRLGFDPYPVLALQLGMTLSDVKVTAFRLRTRYRKLLREEIGQTVSNPTEIDDEIRHLMRVLSEWRRAPGVQREVAENL
jgi:hypothetical protein